MEALSWREVDFAGVVLAGTVGGYIMALAGLWAGRIPGLVAVDIADFGRRYIVSDRPSAWVIGFVSHEVNSIILTLIWAALILPNLNGLRILSSAVWGIVLSIVLAGSLIAPMSGLGFMGRKAGSWRFAATSIVMHLVWGITIGLVYVPA